ncbi:cytochrome P450 9e2 [Megachile rotundata]|uniref:cytochrome P450 9e2 n=1 Tax=Megachile rotundata TaxID=143995 RepID=UPI003FD52590
MDPFTLTLFLVVGFLLLYHFIWEPLSYFKERDVPYQRPLPILGNMAPMLFRRIHMAELLQKLYHRFSGAKYFGLFNFISPIFVIRDPDLILSICVKNFDHFCDHRGFVDPEVDPLMGKNLFALRGDNWREMRKLLSPAFTSRKMKIMFHLIRECADNVSNFIATQSKEKKIFDVKDICGRYTTDVIATCSFGISIDSMRNPNNEFYVLAKKTLNFMTALSWKFMMAICCPKLSNLLGIRLFSEKVHRYFLNVVGETVRTREEKGITRPDMIQLMMESKEKGDRALTIEEMTNQAFVFFFAGYDTSSTFLSFALHEIAVHPDVKAKVIAEVEEVVARTNGNPTYEDIKNMQYLDAVLNETNRLHTLAFTLDRICVKEFQLPPATPGAKPVTLKPGDLVWISPFAIQRDPKYYQDPMTFDPSRFLNGNAPPVHAYVPFGLGPRICIGNRFALLESKILIFYLLWRCDVEPCVKTQIPMKYRKSNFSLLPESGFWLNFRAKNEASLKGINGSCNGASVNGTVSTK